MSAYIKELVDDEENKVYPVTKADAVYMNDNKYTVGNVIQDLSDGNSKIEFPSENVIKKTCPSGNIETTTFNADGSIKTITKDADGNVKQTKTVTFEDDGSINIKVE